LVKHTVGLSVEVDLLTTVTSDKIKNIFLIQFKFNMFPESLVAKCLMVLKLLQTQKLGRQKKENKRKRKK